MYDNIYSFLETLPIIDVYAAVIEGTVIDKQTGLPLKDASVVLTDSENKVFEEANTNENGQYRMFTNKFEAYFVRASLDNYDADESLTQSGLAHQEVSFKLQLNEVALVPGTDLAKVLNIPIIYFDFDKSDIRKDAQVELEKLLAALNQYPNLKIQIRAHTDSRGNDAYNKALSQRRATSTLNSLVANGIDATRLSAVGLGETELVNNCNNGVDCSEEEHHKNRRSEFIVKE
ncbi:OmpA family protein [Gelidibacter sp.]|uniref:OmpA family protein n=1 Tax=Gelidibacter sp. TaxID=2018083 RepID=UPI003264DE1F